MTTPNQELTELICNALQESEVVSAKEAAALNSRIATGKVKPEDWLLAVENSILAAKREGNGN